MCRSEEEGTEETDRNIEMTDRAVINQADRAFTVIYFDEDVVERDVTVAEIKGIKKEEIVEDGEEIREMKGIRVTSIWLVFTLNADV